jgi:hypothetical protein
MMLKHKTTKAVVSQRPKKKSPELQVSGNLDFKLRATSPMSDIRDLLSVTRQLNAETAHFFLK